MAADRKLRDHGFRTVCLRDARAVAIGMVLFKVTWLGLAYALTGAALGGWLGTLVLGWRRAV